MNSPAELVHFQLKYCERCAGLWLRPEGAATPYCPICDPFMSDLPMRIRPTKVGRVQKPLCTMAGFAFAILTISHLLGCFA
jgi:hypothetical protein